MIRSIRAAGFAAVASLVAVVTAWSDPLLAAQAINPAVAAFQHAVAGGDISELGVNQVEPAPQQPSLTELIAARAAVETAGRQEYCLASAVYFEARGEPLEGQLAVAEVVLNRAASGRYPDTICEVVTQPWQFSFVRRGVIPRADRATEAWRKAVAVARIAQAQAMRLLPENVLWYHANYVSPSWGRRLARTRQIGLHIFYS